MNSVFNKTVETWKRPWEIEKFDDLYNRDERFFAILIKGALGWLTNNIVMYNKPIRHYILHSGSSYLYVESNGYEYTTQEVTGEDWMYTELPRCICKYNEVTVTTEELSNPFIVGSYQRPSGNNIVEFNAEIMRVPIELTLNCEYTLSNMNEALILQQELIDKIMFQRYFNIIYLGNIIQCSIEFPTNVTIDINDLDLAATEVNYKKISISLKICSNYPVINRRTEHQSVLISELKLNTDINYSDEEEKNIL